MDKCRQEFEARFSAVPLGKEDSGDYKFINTQMAWIGYQAAWDSRTVKQEQEPVAWRDSNGGIYTILASSMKHKFQPLFTHPPADVQQHTGLIYTCSCDAYKLEIERLKAELEIQDKANDIMESQLAEREADAERLDLIEQQNISLLRYGNPDGWSYRLERGINSPWVHTGKGLREAVDAAILDAVEGK